MLWAGALQSQTEGGSQRRRDFNLPLTASPGPDPYFQEKLLLLTLDLLFHLLVEMLDFFIISSNFPAEVAKGESDEVYARFLYPGLGHQNPIWSRGLGGVTAWLRSVKPAGSVPEDELTQQDLFWLLVLSRWPLLYPPSHLYQTIHTFLGEASLALSSFTLLYCNTKPLASARLTLPPACWSPCLWPA